MSSGEGPPPQVSTRRRLGIGAAIVVVLASLAVTVGIGVIRGATAPTESIGFSPGRSPSPSASVLFVHVAGAVRTPGLYTLPVGARLIDAVAAAGGFAGNAGRDAVNLARAVTDGEQIVVPPKGEGTPGSVTTSTAPGDGRVNLNTADEAALDTLPRIGPAMAKRITQWRADNGRFTSVEDLLAVPGIGEKMLEALRDLVTV